MADIPPSCRRQHGPGTRGETDCLICQETLNDTTQTIVHQDCNRAMCEECFLSWLRTRGAAATCPNCRARLEYNPVPRATNPGSSTVPNLGGYFARQNAVRDRRVEAALSAQTAVDVVTVMGRLNLERRFPWIESRPNLEEELRAAFDSRREERRARVSWKLEDDDEGMRDERSQRREGRSRRNPTEARKRREREARQAIRDASGIADVQAVFDEFNTA